jgi:hypothetical protein
VVARYIDKGNVEPADYVLEIVKGKVAAGNHEVGTESRELVGIKPFVNLVGDREDPRHASGENFAALLQALDLRGADLVEALFEALL